MSIVKNPYNNAKIAQIRQLLINNAHSGKPTDYEIHVDELKVIQRTNDPEVFDNHEEFIDGDTSSITIVLYDGNSRRCTKHLFTLTETKSGDAGLTGVEVNNIVADKLQTQQREWEFELLAKEKRQVEERLREANEYIETLQVDLEEALSKRKMKDIRWGDIASMALEGILRRNPNILSSIPGIGDGLAGVFKGTPVTSEQNNRSEENMDDTVTFKEKENPISEKDRQKIAFVNQLEAAFTEPELGKLVEIIQLFAVGKPALDTILQFLKKQQKSSAQQSQNDQEIDENDPNSHSKAA